MHNLYFSIIFLLAVCFFIFSIIAIFQNVISQEKLKIQSEEINRLTELYKKQCEELLEILIQKKELKVLQAYINTEKTKPCEYNIKELLKQAQFSSKDWDKIEQYINETQNQFVSKLTDKYPALSKEDIHTILLMRLNISNIEIAAFYNIQLSSLTTKRYRIMKKMGLPKSSSNIEFRNNLFRNDLQNP